MMGAVVQWTQWRLVPLMMVYTVRVCHDDARRKVMIAIVDDCEEGMIAILLKYGGVVLSLLIK